MFNPELPAGMGAEEILSFTSIFSETIIRREKNFLDKETFEETISEIN